MVEIIPPISPGPLLVLFPYRVVSLIHFLKDLVHLFMRGESGGQPFAGNLCMQDLICPIKTMERDGEGLSPLELLRIGVSCGAGSIAQIGNTVVNVEQLLSAIHVQSLCIGETAKCAQAVERFHGQVAMAAFVQQDR